ncbi:hypothetical protein [Pseudoalteromonas phage J2-1_QLiu-2017]|nr:hypothetical protein [Pseudoalteromonas phage J2-1_QLiu-2017]
MKPSYVLIENFGYTEIFEQNQKITVFASESKALATTTLMALRKGKKSVYDLK